ncbi:fungal-specific transcription factor domain-containing protein [Xylaria arbuscula]|nr:fungal-specific transcription factor domain-containing protein [Xylaria arbuscula]
MERHRPAYLSASSSRTCCNCQKRKSRCLRAHPEDTSCIYCNKTRKKCVFESPPDRTPLTRRNLDATELQIVKLRALLRSLHPDLDIDAALRRLETSGDNSDQSRPQAYEWHENYLSEGAEIGDNGTVSNDGMANLPADENSGTLESHPFVGVSAGSQLLQEIVSAISSCGIARHASEDLRRPRSSTLRAEPVLDVAIELSATANHLINNYFSFYNTCYPILHEKSFRERIADQRSRPLGLPCRVTFYMVLAIGDWISSREPCHSHSPFYKAARSCLSFTMLESGTVETVQAFLLLGNYLQKRDRPNTGYNLVGLAWKLALGLGLHREVASSHDTIHQQRLRSLFWITYCFDNGFNITTGRPPTLSDGFIDTRTPRNIEDKDLLLTSDVPPEVDYPTTYAAIIALAQLAKVAEGIYQEFLLAKTAGSKVEYRVAELMERRLDDWRRSLPEYFTANEVPPWFLSPRAIVLWKEQNLRILLWRGSRDHHGFLPNKPNAGNKCLEIAMQSTDDIATFCTTNEADLHQGVIWYATYFLFQAALVLEANYLQSSRQKSNEDTSFQEKTLCQARSCFQMLAQTSNSAKRCMEVLDNIHQRLRGLVLDPPGTGEPCALDDPQMSFVQPSAGFVSDESDFGLFSSGLGFGDNVVDPTLRMLINPDSSNLFEEMPLDMLLDHWVT